jgi:dTDP-4-amino-4,6-dideoxygalactose transaminase
MNINVLKPKFDIDNILSEIKECLELGWTGMGFKTVKFEEAWKKYTNLPHAHFIASNTVGLHLALNLYKNKYNWKDEDEIITTPLTFISSNHAIMYERLKPIFADVDEFLCLDPKSIEERITPKTKAVMFVGMGGNTGKLSEVKHICKKHNLKLILDAAHMSGTKIKNVFDGVGYSIEHVGKEADVTIFSFQAVKNLPTADSGMICFKDKEDDKLVRQLSWLGIDKDTYSRSTKGSYKWKYDVPNIGFKYHGNSIMASIGLVQLKKLDEENDYRNIIFSWYKKHLNKDIKIIEDSWYTYKSSKHLFQILTNNREKLINKLYKNNIYPGVHYVDNTTYKMYKYAYGTCPKAHKYSTQLLTLPIHLDLTEKDVKKISNIINLEYEKI